MKRANEAVDAVRCQEHRALMAKGDTSLAKTKYLWLYAEENLPAKYQERFASLKGLDLKTARAWAIKESLRRFWRYQDVRWAKKYWRWWYFWATHRRLKPVIKLAKMLKRHLDNLLTYFKYRVTNVVSEGLNNKIEAIKRQAYGFRNRQHFKTAIYFYCGGLQLYPQTHGNVR